MQRKPNTLKKAKGQESIRKILEEKGIKVIDEIMCNNCRRYYGHNYRRRRYI